MADYEATIDDERKVLYGGTAIPRVAYTGSSSDDLSWGYDGAGATNTARSILEHAHGELDIDFDPAELQIPFRREYVASRDSSEEWSISLAEVEQFIESNIDS